jgi:type IV pilus assembly protein PilM
MTTTLGIDIGSHTIKLIEITQEKGVCTLRAAGSMLSPEKDSAPNTSSDVEQLVYVIRQLVADTGAKSENVMLAFPESKVFTRVIEVPNLSKRELMSAIQYEAEQYIPLPLDQVNIDYTVLRDAKTTPDKKMEILLVGAPKNLIDRSMHVLDDCDLLPVAAETEILASGRAVFPSVSHLSTFMLISSGAQTTDIAIFRKGIISFARSIAVGGEALSRSLVQSLDFSFAQAEEYKKTYGLSKDVLEGKLVVAMEPIMATLVAEIKRAVAFFGEKHKEERIESIVLAGGTAKMPGLVSFLTEAIGIETQLANPWKNIVKETRFAVLDQEGPVFTVAVGLALRAV